MIDAPLALALVALAMTIGAWAWERSRTNQARATAGSMYGKLQALRRNCYLTDADGVRRRYGRVSPAVRAKAEQ